MIRIRLGRVLEISATRPGVTEMLVDVDGGTAPALNYDDVCGPVAVGDEVVLNTSAVSLGLGTGGWHLVMAVVREGARDLKGPGHSMKLRYAPTQVRVLAVEEPESPHHDVMRAHTSLDGMPVVVADLHSQVAAVAVGVKLADPGCRVAYVMTDGAALVASFSRLLCELKARNLIDCVVTTGQCFGGDLEAISLPSGLIAARWVGEARVGIVAQGPGNLGSATPFGFSGAAAADALNTAAVLGGRPIAALRISFADSRQRHQGVSHHTLTVLGRLTLARCLVAVPALGADEDEVLWRQLEQAGVASRHALLRVDGDPVIDAMVSEGFTPTTMGRTLGEEKAFFSAAGAAGLLAGRLALGFEVP